MKGKNPSLPLKCEETLRLQISETVWPVHTPLRMSWSSAEAPTALPTRHERDPAPVWRVAAAPDGDGEQWDKHGSRALWVTEIPSGLDPFLAPVWSGGSDALLLTQTLGMEEDVSPTTPCPARVKYHLVLPTELAKRPLCLGYELSRL